MNPKIVFHDLKMEIPADTGIAFHSYSELMYIIFDKPYCRLYFTGNAKYRVEVSLQCMLDNLPDAAFLKCKRSSVLNICHCQKLKKNPPLAVMPDGAEIRLTQQNVLKFKRMMDNLSCISPPCQGCYTCTIEKCENRMIFCRRERTGN